MASAADEKKTATKRELYQKIQDKSGVSKRETEAVLEALDAVIAEELGKGGPGQVILPGVLRMKVIVKPATKERQGTNPFTKEPMTIKSKPASRTVKITPAKLLKDQLS